MENFRDAPSAMSSQDILRAPGGRPAETHNRCQSPFERVSAFQFHSYRDDDWRERAAASYVIFDPEKSVTRLNLERPLHVADKSPASRVEIWRSDRVGRVGRLEESLFAQFGIVRRLRTIHPHIAHCHIAVHTYIKGVWQSVTLTFGAFDLNVATFMAELQEQQVAPYLHPQNVDTSSSGRAMLGMASVFAAFERDISIERVAGLCRNVSHVPNWILTSDARQAASTRCTWAGSTYRD